MREIIIHTPTKEYSVFIDETHNLESIVHNGKVLIVSNPKVAGLHLSKIIAKIMAKEVYVCIIPDGEEYKDFKSVEYILECAFTHRLDRNSLFVAFGGGVVGDIVGFVSGIYQRGVEFIQIPTTLLAQVDSSVGGKTGINNVFGKNLIGLFHQPKAVYVNLDLLATLDSREFSAGVAEIIKMAVCFDKEFFTYLQNTALDDKQILEYVIAKSIEIKARVVSQDEKEKGLRAALNYGHTFGHVIENLTHYTGYLHGECVAIGMCMANDLAYKLGLMTQEEVECIKHLLMRYNLPTYYKIADVREFWEKFFLDKKSKDSKITFILPNHIGDVCMRDDIPKEIVMQVLEQYSK
ncbi:3-dehydroquinate synthase [Helicobacter equorum]|uniref:3-dehydroquinate synthase n=1 Tax=Helicobacter equorum TaxID=361872 RepID=UPI000CF05135|nr:3-dehydroquinate synthase [Helicobacter equorum]